MVFNFSRHGLKGGERKLQRVLEIIPGLTSWCIILGMLILSFWQPFAAAIIIIAFDIYWLLKLLYLTLFLVLSYFRLSLEDKTDWMARVKGLDNLKAYLKSVEKIPESAGFKDKLSFSIHRKEIALLVKGKVSFPSSENIYHVVVIPVAKETRDIVEPGVESLMGGTFPSGRILVVLALEERARDEVKKGIEGIRAKYRNSFLNIIVVLHKDDIPGEAKVKGANVTHAAKEAATYLRTKKIPFESVVVSCFDSDTVVTEQYFACLTYNFMITPDRTRASFQPIPVYYNNIWEVPAFARVLETGSSFFQLIEATNSEKLVTFSSHSMSFKALVEVGYWPVDMVSDDSAIFWKAYIYYDGKYRVVPMYTTLSMDIVAGDSWWKTIVNEYKQKRRWAWGVENFPIVTRGFLKNRKISLYNKVRLIFKLFEGHIAWATWAFLLTFIGWLPALFASRAFQHSVVYYSAPRITGTIFNLASLSLVTSIILSILLLPKKKIKHALFQKVAFGLQWLLVPLIILFLSAIPALDAQTRLMLGKRMEFWVADKKREKDS